MGIERSRFAQRALGVARQVAQAQRASQERALAGASPTAAPVDVDALGDAAEALLGLALKKLGGDGAPGWTRTAVQELSGAGGLWSARDPLEVAQVPEAIRQKLPPALMRDVAQVDPGLLALLPTLEPVVFEGWEQVDAELLRLNGFGTRQFIETLLWQDAIARGEPEGTPTPPGEVTPFTAEHVTALPRKGSKAYEALRALGEQSRKDGKVAKFELFGGRASRMQNHVKAVVKVVGDQTFLDIKLQQARKAGVPLVIGTSPATDADIKAHLLQRMAEEQGEAAAQAARAQLSDGPLSRIGDVTLVRQGVQPAIDAETGRLALFSNGEPYYYPPGHGAFFETFHSSGLIAQLQAAGVEYVISGNGDNLGQDFDDALLGLHIQSGKALTAEAAKVTQQTGLFANVDGAPAVLEYVPEGVDASALGFGNTNSFTYTLDALAGQVVRPPARVVEKTPRHPVTGETLRVKQRELVTGEATWLRSPDGGQLLPTQVVVVKSLGQGDDWRFAPIKSWDDLKRSWRPIARRVGLEPVAPGFPEGV